MNSMNLSSMRSGVSGSLNGGSIFMGGLFGMQTGQLKSTQEKMERMEKASNEVFYWEQKKDALKQVEATTLEEIQRKLDCLHSYEDQIRAVKQAYNSEQAFHVMDEQEELAEKIAEEVEKNKPKTPEERKEEAIEEAIENITGEEGNDGALSDILDEMEEVQDEMEEEQLENLEEMSQEDLKKTDIEAMKKIEEYMPEKQNIILMSEQEKRQVLASYKKFDVFI